MEVRYLNTDLELESKDDLSRIVEEFGEAVLVLHRGEIREYQNASFEIAGSTSGAYEVINYFCSLVNGLPVEVRRIWDGCCSRILTLDMKVEPLHPITDLILELLRLREWLKLEQVLLLPSTRLMRTRALNNERA